ncbi:MAG: glycosyltransferase [Chloroflexi bacterium]|nr:glycosyltransferase [Chloroflexota bacterium]
MRIAMLCYHSCPLARLGEREAGGMSVYVRNLAQALGRQGAVVDIFPRRHNSGDLPVTPMGEGVRLVHIEAGPQDSVAGPLLPYLPDFVSGAKSFAMAEGASYDVVHSHYWLSGLAGLELAPAWGARLAATFHTLAEVKLLADPSADELPERSPAERRIVAGADAIVVSDRHERDLLARHYGAPRARVTVLPGGVDVETFHPIDRVEAKRRLGLKGKRVLLCVGRFDPLKRYDLAVSAAALLRERHDVEVVLVGGDLDNDPEAERLSALAKTLGMDGSVRFAGTVPHDALPSYYSAADVLLAPSWYESFGLVALEAMACGTPVVAARTGGLASLVRDGETGYLVPLHTPECYADRVEVLLTNDALRGAMGRAGRSRAEGMGWDAIGWRFAEFYGGLLAAEAVR